MSTRRQHVNCYPPGIAPIDTIPNYGGVLSSPGAQIGAQWNQKSEATLAEDLRRDSKWYQKSGKVLPKSQSWEWASTLMACNGIISFDAVLCNGPRHAILMTDSPDKSSDASPWYESVDAQLSPRVASYVLEGCVGCGTSPEGFSVFPGSPLEQFPLLTPLPRHSPSTKAAKTPFSHDSTTKTKLLARCFDCLDGRYCESCHKWWCENCYEIQNHRAYVTGQPQPWKIGSLAPSHVTEADKKNVKVHMGLCVEDCLVTEMMSGAGSNGMWG